MSLAEAGALCGLVWLAAGWWPSLPARGSGVVPLIRFGGAVALRDLMAVVTLSADRFLLGRLFGPEEVGIYTRAHALLLRPLTQVIPPLQAVALPVFSRLQSDDDRYRSVVLRTLKLASFGSSFVAATILSTSDWLVVALLGDQWAESGVIFRFFAVAVFTAPVNAVLSWVLLTQHEGKELLRWGLMNDGLLIASIACAAPWGAEAVALSYSVSGLLIRTPLLYYVVSTCSPLRTSELAKATVPGAVLGSAAVALIATWRLAVGDISPWVGIAVSTVILLSYYSIVAGFTSWGRHAVIIAATLTKGVRASG